MFSSFIVWYLVLAGAGSGALAVAAVFEFRRGGSEGLGMGSLRSGQGGFVVAPPLIALAGVALTLDLGRPDRIWSVMLHPFHSIASFGACSLVGVLALSVATVAYLALRRDPSARIARALLIVDMVFALATMAYSGLLLSTLQSVPFWETLLVPALFVISSLSAGLALVVCVGFFLGSSACETYDAASWTASTALSVIEAVVLFALLTHAAASGGAAADSLNSLLFGGGALLFWAGIVGAGLLVPVACHLLSRLFPRQVLLLVSLSGVLVGTVCLRYGIVDAGMNVIEATGTVL